MTVLHGCTATLSGLHCVHMNDCVGHSSSVNLRSVRSMKTLNMYREESGVGAAARLHVILQHMTLCMHN